MFITLYGINNIGKTYHAKLLVRRLKKMGKKAVYIKYPIYSKKPTGPLLNKLLRSGASQKMSEEELQLWFVLNRYQFQPTLDKLLKKKAIVIAEDYIGTGIAWGMAKSKDPQRMKKELENMNKFLVQPDLSILMDGKRDRAAEEKKHIHESNNALVQRCRKMYQQLSREYKWKKVEVAPDKEVTAERIWKAFLS